jgi:hypothetical protein
VTRAGLVVVLLWVFGLKGLHSFSGTARDIVPSKR